VHRAGKTEQGETGRETDARLDVTLSASRPKNRTDEVLTCRAHIARSKTEKNCSEKSGRNVAEELKAGKNDKATAKGK